MQIYIVFFLFLSSLFIRFGLDSDVVAGKSQSTSQTPTATPKPNPPVNADSVTFDKETVHLWCPMPKHSYCPKDEQSVQVNVIAKNVRNDKLTYYYIVSGGRIIGQGANVVWDFSNKPPGKYTITVGIGSGYVVRGKTITKTIEVKECPICDLSCTCPSLTISRPTESVKAGDAFIVAADVQGGEKEESITYKWTVSGGTIINGQKASQAVIKTTSDMADSSVKVTVEIGGTDPSCNCSTIVSETISIQGEKP